MENTDRNKDSRNPYLMMGFIEFGIIATLMVALFPWSLLFSLFFYGMERTKFLVVALIHDAIKTILAILSIVVPLIAIIGVIALLASQ